MHVQILIYTIQVRMYCIIIIPLQVILVPIVRLILRSANLVPVRTMVPVRMGSMSTPVTVQEQVSLDVKPYLNSYAADG